MHTAVNNSVAHHKVKSSAYFVKEKKELNPKTTGLID